MRSESMSGRGNNESKGPVVRICLECLRCSAEVRVAQGVREGAKDEGGKVKVTGPQDLWFEVRTQAFV